MWKVLCMWTKSLEDKTISFADCCNERFEVRDDIKSYLRQIAVVNVCKEHGKGTNIQEEIDAKIADAINQYYKYVQDEIAIVNPDVVVCCGTYHFIRGQYNSPEMVLPSGARCFSSDGRTYVEMMHPASRMGYREMFAYFKEVRSALKC